MGTRHRVGGEGHGMADSEMGRAEPTAGEAKGVSGATLS